MPVSAQEAKRSVELLLDGVAPERAAELRGLWARYAPEFQHLDDDGPDGTYVLDAGLYRFVRFNHRVMRLFWLGAFIAWEGYSALHHQLLPHNEPVFERFKAMLEVFDVMLRAQDSSAVPMPAGVPEPGAFPADAQARAPAELAVFSVGWALLHEFKHIQHQQEGTAAPHDAPPKKLRADEYICDEYATRFILDRVPDYAQENGVADVRVRFKRQVGIFFALFTMALILRERWGETDTHPALQDRITAVRRAMGLGIEIAPADAIAFAAFAALRQIYPSAPQLEV